MVYLKGYIHDLKGIKDLKASFDFEDFKNYIYEESLCRELIEENLSFWEELENLKITFDKLEGLEWIKIFQILRKIKYKNKKLNIWLNLILYIEFKLK